MKISIEGNVGAGKSTIVDAIESFFPTIPVHREPVHEWQELLDLYYKDPKTWALAMNLKVLMSFTDVRHADNVFVERSPMSCKHVFGQMEYSDKRFDKMQWDIFSDYCDLLGWAPDAIIFIDTPAATCLARVESRKRPCESGVNLEFLKRIEFQYEAMVKLCRTQNIPVFVVDGTQHVEQVKAAVIAAILRLVTGTKKIDQSGT